ncbi:MAG: hypothetical protein ACRDH2_20005 [Anaerolineales bacterium]
MDHNQLVARNLAATRARRRRTVRQRVRQALLRCAWLLYGSRAATARRQ